MLVAIDATTALLFGGVGASGVLADTWQWDAQNSTWIERTGVVNPPARQRHAMAALAGSVLIFGGAATPVPSHAQALGDTWEWNGNTWQRLLVDAAAESMPAPDYDLALGNFGSTLTLFSGDYNTTGSWIWDASAKAWSQLNVGPPPEPLQPPIYVATLATAQGQRLILSGNSPWNGVTMTQWDGSAWSWFPAPPSASYGDSAPPLASVGGALVTLTGSPQRTYVYTSR